MSWLQRLLCRFGGHRWRVHGLCGFWRVCTRCGRREAMDLVRGTWIDSKQSQ